MAKKSVPESARSVEELRKLFMSEEERRQFAATLNPLIDKSNGIQTLASVADLLRSLGYVWASCELPDLLDNIFRVTDVISAALEFEVERFEVARFQDR